MLMMLVLIILAVAFFYAGIFLGKKEKRIHLPVLGFILLPVVVRIISTQTSLNFPPFNWFIGGRIADLIVCFCVLVIFGAGYGSIEIRRKRIAITVFSVLITMFYVIYPEFFSIFLQGKLQKLQGNIYKEGICFQTSRYSCGPASAVMFLHAVGVKSTEAEMAALAETNNLTGTYIDKLTNAVNIKLKPAGLKAKYEKTDYDTIQSLNKPFLAKINLRFMVDHYIVVFEVTDDEVIVGDPLEGRGLYSKKAFLKKWRRVVIRSY